MKRLVVGIFSFLIAVVAFSQRWQSADTLRELTPQQADSLFFRFSHHYTVNFNFLVHADSITLIPHESDFTDTCLVYKDEVVVVADIRQTDDDTVWIKLFRDQYTMGWVSEQDLLSSATPNDIISQIIDFASRHLALPIAVAVLLLIIGCLFFRINKFYSAFYVLLILGFVSSILYVFQVDNEYWQEFYFHPTLNPFILPDEMMLVVGLFWLVCITSIALLFVLSDYISRKSVQL